MTFNPKRVVGPLEPSSSSLSSSSSTSTYFTNRSTPSSSMSSVTKLEQIIQNFYNKTAQIIIQSRIPNLKSVATRRKLNKWFNMTTNESESLKEELKFWRYFIRHEGRDEPPPPLVIDIYLETTEPELLQEGDDIHGWHKLDFGNHHRILIESWTLTLNSTSIPDFQVVDLPNLYKRSIVFFRSLHSLVRLLPGYKLFQKLRLHRGEMALRYRLSANKSTKMDEISFDHPLTKTDTIQQYKFKDLVTPLGVFKLNLQYREHCQFGTKEESPLHGIGVEENFFTPTMTKYRQEQNMNDDYPKQVPSSSTSSARSRIHSYRRSSSNTSALERRISAPMVSPFKSPSLSSSSPQAELMFASRSQTTSSFGKRTEFSSSFEKFFKDGSSSHIHRVHSTAADMATSRSRVSDHSSIHQDFEEDEGGLQEFMNLIGARQELKLFRSSNNNAQSAFIGVEEDTSKPLTHFRNIQETHTMLSDSMSMSQQKGSYESLNKQQQHNLPSISSPLKNRQAPPPPPPPKNPKHRTSVADDDDSLVFKMSELSGYDENLAQSHFYFNNDMKYKASTNALTDTTNSNRRSTTTYNNQEHLDNMTKRFYLA